MGKYKMYFFVFYWLFYISNPSEDSTEAQKWQQHLSLLREQYVNLYNINIELQREYAIVTANKQDTGFISRLLTTIASLFNQHRYRFIITLLSIILLYIIS